MEKLKIVITGNEDIAKEAKELFKELGYYSSSKKRSNSYGWSIGEKEGDYYSEKFDFDDDAARLVTINELRALVSLHKNPINMDKVLSGVRSDALGLLNDQYAEIEQVRKEYKLRNDMTVDDYIDKLRCADAESLKHNHYFIDVSDVDEVDFYEIALRYNVTDPCIQHILKKCLAVGNRGHKDFHTDLKDIYDTADRALRIHGG